MKDYDNRDYTKEDLEMFELFGKIEAIALDVIMDLCPNDEAYSYVVEHGLKYPSNLQPEDEICLKEYIPKIGKRINDRIIINQEIIDKLAVVLL